MRSSRKKVFESSNEDSSDEEASTLLANKFGRFLKFNKGSKNPKVDAVKGDSLGDTQGKREKPKKDMNS